jgi:hypothetical protein
VNMRAAYKYKKTYLALTFGNFETLISSRFAQVLCYFLNTIFAWTEKNHFQSISIIGKVLAML